MDAIESFDELIARVTSPEAEEKRTQNAEAALKAWNAPHEVEMRRLYAEQERHQIEAERAEDATPEYFFDWTLFKYVKM